MFTQLSFNKLIIIYYVYNKLILLSNVVLLIFMINQKILIQIIAAENFGHFRYVYQGLLL